MLIAFHGCVAIPGLPEIAIRLRRAMSWAGSPRTPPPKRSAALSSGTSNRREGQLPEWRLVLVQDVADISSPCLSDR